MSARPDQAPTPPPARERLLILLLRVVRLALRALTWPARLLRKWRRLPLRITAFRGYGTAHTAIVRGRLVDTPPVAGVGRGRLARIRALFRRLGTPPVPRALVEGRLRGRSASARTGPDGLFTLRFDGLELAEEGQWEEVPLVAQPVRRRGPGASATGEVLIPRPGAGLAIVSDIDDTVVHTGVANKLAMMWRLFATEAEARTAFSGVGALYRALHRGRGAADNPIFYVSRGPWSIYPVLEEFFQRREIPIGPILLLRDWGVHLGHPWPRRARDHKRALLDELLEIYPRLPFLLIGDSGQHDPEIYADATERWGQRIVCSYIRDVSGDERRSVEIRQLARRCQQLGSEMVLAQDSAALAEHAARRGFIAPDQVAAIVRASRQEKAAAAGSRPAPMPQRRA